MAADHGVERCGVEVEFVAVHDDALDTLAVGTFASRHEHLRRQVRQHHPACRTDRPGGGETGLAIAASHVQDLIALVQPGTLDDDLVECAAALRRLEHVVPALPSGCGCLPDLPLSSF